MQGDHMFTNKLVNETSPYLLQHAHNPVDWHPWGEEALEKAKKENKLLIISVGYAACHWCHVMEKESFEDTLVANIMNQYFVPIKVDREERPDVDDVYMTACHLVSGRGGWPLNAFALPDGRPVWAGTYFPQDQWINILKQFIDLQKDDPKKLEESAEKITSGIQSSDALPIVTEQSEFTKDHLDNIVSNFVSNIDYTEGGREGAPKFPMPNNYEFLLTHHGLSAKQDVLDAVTITLDKMARGGIYDHLGGGFARYSVDAVWKVPHFEKMLYDNGQLVALYSKAYRLTKNPLYKSVVKETLDFIERELMSKEGGFYSSLDADSEGVEGKFYVWDKEEIDSLIGNEDIAKLYTDYYSITSHGNWEESNILHRTKADAEFIKEHNITQEQLNDLKASVNPGLLKEREKRIRPGLDDKILTSWNALMSYGYIEAYKTFGESRYRDIAIRNVELMMNKQKDTGLRLNRNYKNGKSSINAFLDDYAILIQALVGLYEITFNEEWLTKAAAYTEYVIEHFQNKENGMFNYTSDLDPPLVARKSEISDNVIPASNSIMARNLRNIGELMYNESFLTMSQQMIMNVKETIETVQQPNFYSNWCSLYQEYVHPPYEIAIVGKNADKLRNEMTQRYTPNCIYLGGTSEGTLALLQNKLNEDETFIYVCQNKACKFPVTTVDEAMELIK